MMKNRFYLLFIGIVHTFLLSAQSDVDALRYSRLTFGGTARFTSMAGAFGALGADASVLSFNPAGIGMYTKTEFSFTPSLFGQSTFSSYNGTHSSDSKFNFNFGNIAFIATYNTRGSDNVWKSFNFGFGYNRTNHFHNRMDMRGSNASSSLLDVYLSSANGKTPAKLDDFSDGLAFETYLLDTFKGSPTAYYSAVPFAGTLQRKTVETGGRMGETVLSFGGNYNDKLYLGATVGIPSIRYEEESIYEESDDQDTIPYFDSFKLSQDIAISGRGINFKFGIIYRPVDWLRLGGAVHTPSFFSLSDQYSTRMQSYFDGGQWYEAKSPSGNFRYRVTTPSRLLGSVAFIIAKRGLISADYEFLNYSLASLHASPNVFADVNNTIKSKYTVAENIRVGGELRLDPVSFRAGYALYGSPFRSQEYDHGNQNTYTMGLGFRKEAFFVDLAYALTQSSEEYYLYEPSSYIRVNPVTNKFRNSRFLVTVGFRY